MAPMVAQDQKVDATGTPLWRSTYLDSRKNSKKNAQ